MPRPSSSPLRAIFDIRRQELPQVLMMLGYFLLVITTFWVLKPIKKSMFIAHYDADGFDIGLTVLTAAQAELLAKVLNMVVAYVAVSVFSALSNRYRRHQLTVIFGGFFIAGFLLFAVLLDHPGGLTVWAFYLYGDAYSTLMVAAFFVYLNDIATPDSAKRTYGLVGLGGVVGGFLGSMLLASFIHDVSATYWLLLCVVLTLVVIGLALGVARNRARHPELRAERPSEPPEPAAKGAGNPALDGARLVFRSRYLLSVVGIVGIYEMVSTILDFQFSASLSHYLDGPEIGGHLTMVFAIMNGTAFLVQLFLTSYVMNRHGVRVALMILPLTTMLASGGFLVFPVLWMGSLIPTLDGGFAYSINQSAKESLYVPTTREERYKAKAFIDMFVQRFAKSLAVGLSLTMTLVVTDFSGVRWLSLVTLLLTTAWLFIARYVGAQFDALAPPEEADAA